MYRRQELQNLILSTIDLDNLIQFPKEISLDAMYPGNFVYFSLSKDTLRNLYGSFQTFNDIEITKARLYIHYKGTLDSKGNLKIKKSSIYLKFNTGKHGVLPILINQIDKIKPLFQDNGKYYPYSKHRSAPNCNVSKYLTLSPAFQPALN